MNEALRTGLAAEELGQRRERSRLDYMAEIAKLVSKDDRTSAMKNYEYAQAQGFKGSFEEWEKDAKTTHMKEYAAAVEGGYEGSFHQWLLELAKASKTEINLGEVKDKAKAQAEAKAEVANRQYFNSPKFKTDIDKDVEDLEYNWRAEADPVKRAKIRATILKNAVEARITSSGGKITGVRAEGTDMIWTVKFADGTVGEVRYALRGL